MALATVIHNPLGVSNACSNAIVHVSECKADNVIAGDAVDCSTFTITTDDPCCS